MKAATPEERRAAEARRDKQLLDLGLNLLTTNTVGLNIKGCPRSCYGPELPVHVSTVIGDDHVLQYIFQAVYEAGLRDGREEIRQGLKSLLKSETDDG